MDMIARYRETREKVTKRIARGDACEHARAQVIGDAVKIEIHSCGNYKHLPRS